MVPPLPADQARPARLGAGAGTGRRRSTKAYGDMGRYGSVVNPFPALEAAETSSAPAPRFEAAQPLDVKLGQGSAGPSRLISRASSTCWPGCDRGLARRSQPLTPTATASSTSTWPRPSPARREFVMCCCSTRETAGSRMPRPPSGCPSDRASIGVAAADFDADRHIDLFLTGVGDNRLLRNRGGKKFEDISSSAQADGRACRLAHGALARSRPGRRPRSLRRELLRGRACRQGVHRGRGPAARYCERRLSQ